MKVLTKIRRWTIALVILAISAEMFWSIVFFSKYHTSSLAIVELVKKFTDRSPSRQQYLDMHQLTRADSSAEMCKRVTEEVWSANRYTYEPWVMFRMADHHSTYVNIKGFERKCIPSEIIHPEGRDTIDIFFFGGSTMYGWNLADTETIPSQLLQIYQKNYPDGKSVRIRNYGIPYYYSKQEIMLFSKLVFEGERPDIVVFMDGLNDFYPSRMLYYDQPHFAYAMQQKFDNNMFANNSRTVIDTSEKFYKDVPGIPAATYYQELHDKYINHLGYAATLAEKIGAKSYFFCQPVPFYNYENRDNDPISFKNDFDRYNYIYPLLKKEEGQIKNFTYLGDMLQHQKGMPFIDQVHYSPAFARKIAENILLKIKGDINN